MPDGAAPDLTFKRAVRGRFAPLIMISGPSGTGKTYSALRLASGMAGPNGKICVADTDRGRARLYADRFKFDTLDLIEPYRPQLFEAAARAAQAQGADVLIVDNFGHEWAGPGGVLEWHEQELERMAGDDFARREAVKMIGWAKVKPAHKKMLQRLYQLNLPIILCTYAERKVAVKEITDNRGRKKMQPVDLGFQPVGDKDIAFAMTASLLLDDVAHPGRPKPIKALLADLEPIIHLDRPLDEETGAAIAAWARGDAPTQKKTPAPVSSEGAGAEVGPRNVTPSIGERGDPDLHTEPPPDNPTPPSDDEIPPPDDETPPADPPPRSRRTPSEDEIAAGAQALIAQFEATKDRIEHLAIVDNADNRRRLEWLKRHRRELYGMVDAAVKNSWKRTDPKAIAEAAKQGDMIP